MRRFCRKRVAEEREITDDEEGEVLVDISKEIKVEINERDLTKVDEKSNLKLQDLLAYLVGFVSQWNLSVAI